MKEMSHSRSSFNGEGTVPTIMVIEAPVLINPGNGFIRSYWVIVRPSPEALRGTSLEMPGPDRGPPYLPEHAYKANRKSV